MKAISLWQPWASMIAVREKKIETRMWRTHYRGPLLICAAKTIDPAGPHKDWRPTMRLGRMICWCELVDCRPMRQEDSWAACFPWSDGRWAWILEGVTPVKAVPIIGRQGLFNVPDDLVQVES